MKYKCLSIAGFDGSGGAGIQADIKAFSALGCYGMTVLTALPIQNTCGVSNCYTIPLSAVREQLEAIFSDIVPDSIKIGMLFNSEIIELVADFLSEDAVNIPIILDPVMVAKSGDPLLLPEAVEELKIKLLPKVSIVTPNIPEALTLLGIKQQEEKLCDVDHHVFMRNIACKLIDLGANAVMLKGGHLSDYSGVAISESDDLYIDSSGKEVWMKGERIDTKNTHGTGCTLSSAIAAYVAQGLDFPTACLMAKQYLFEALKAASKESVGKGRGPVHHFYNFWK